MLHAPPGFENLRRRGRFNSRRQCRNSRAGLQLGRSAPAQKRPDGGDAQGRYCEVGHLETIAKRCGFTSAEILRRLFQRRLGREPDRLQGALSIGTLKDASG